jgi:integrase
MELTKDTIADLKLPEGKADAIFFCDSLPGFGVQLRAGGKAVYVAQYRVDGGTRRETLGDVRKIELDAARKAAKQRFAAVTLGRDPQAEKAEAKARATLKLGAVADRYLEAKKDKLRPNTYNAAKLHFMVHWKPLRDRSLDGNNKIGRADVAARLQKIITDHGRRAAAAARRNLSALFGWAMREGLCESNPVAVTNDPAEGLRSRDRVLSDSELRSIWKACQDDDFGRIVRLLAMTGCRREEIGGLLWKEVDLDAGTITIPGTRTKNHRTHKLELPPVALDILGSQPRRHDREFVFGNRGGAFSAWSYSTIALNNRIAAAEGKPLDGWRLHDLRRTLRTGMGKIGVAPHIAELVINRVKGGVEAIYDRHKYEREIAAALALWADHVMAVVEGRESVVTPFQRAKG